MLIAFGFAAISVPANVHVRWWCGPPGGGGGPSLGNRPPGGGGGPSSLGWGTTRGGGDAMHSVTRKQHPCPSNTGRWFRQFQVIAWIRGWRGVSNPLIPPDRRFLRFRFYCPTGFLSDSEMVAALSDRLRDCLMPNAQFKVCKLGFQGQPQGPVMRGSQKRAKIGDSGSCQDAFAFHD